MAVGRCTRDANEYLRLLLQLMPPGYAWQWSPSSVGRHLLAAWSDELTRVNDFFCSLVEDGISRFVGEMTGWLASDYEQRLSEKFNLVAAVSDGLSPFSCESSCIDPLLDERIIYVYTITVDSVSDVSAAVISDLKHYQQSHTHFHFRDRSITLEQVSNIDGLHLGSEIPLQIIQSPSIVDVVMIDDVLIETESVRESVLVNGGMHCESPLYEQDFNAMTLVYDYSWGWDEVIRFSDWPVILAGMPTGVQILRG